MTSRSTKIEACATLLQLGERGTIGALASAALMIVLLFCGAFAPRVVHAQTPPVNGRWIFTTHIRGTTCTVNTPPVVRLPRIQARALAIAGQIAGTKPVELKLTGCDSNIHFAQFTFLTNGDAWSPPYFATDTGVGHAKGVALYLATGDGTQLQANGTNNVVPHVPVTANQAKLQVFVSYVGNGQPVTPGIVTGRIEFEVSYN
jgi:type 1 fimbria pilin